MNSRERLIKVLRGEIPDHVPVAPDFSNMIPAKKTGKPWWDIYLYNDPPIWEAYIDCAKFFNIDALMDGYFPFKFPWEQEANAQFEAENPAFIVAENDEHIIIQRRGPHLKWHETLDIYWRDKTPSMGIPCSHMEMPDIPVKFRPLEGVKAPDLGLEGLKKIKQRLGNQGLLGVFVVSTCFINNADELYDFFDHPEKGAKIREKALEACQRKMDFLGNLAPEYRPDFVCLGGSGTLILQSIEMVREVIFPAVKLGTELAEKYGFFSHIHSCGPEKALVKLMAQESCLSVIDPLEIPPMGDCVLAELKRLYGDKIVLKGNLHTTDVMLNGSPDDVRLAARQAIDDAATGGRFILSTGDQCGRDTPDENLFALVETAKNYGKYH